MTKIEEKLEALFAKLRTLPEARQQAALEALCDITEEPYRLSDDELAVLQPALERVHRGEATGNASTDDVL